jgi:hypothetical protein
VASRPANDNNFARAQFKETRSTLTFAVASEAHAQAALNTPLHIGGKRLLVTTTARPPHISVKIVGLPFITSAEDVTRDAAKCFGKVFGSRIATKATSKGVLVNSDAAYVDIPQDAPSLMFVTINT